MPTDTAATSSRSGCVASLPLATRPDKASCRATQAPVMEAQRVPPSACSTSQSSVIWRSPSAVRSVTARRLRPISRWISCVRPDCLPVAASRELRVLVARGSMPYSAVTQPEPLPLRNGGTFSSTLAVHSTRVCPISTRTEPSACLVNRRWKRTGRRSAAPRSKDRFMVVFLLWKLARDLADRVLYFLDGALDILVRDVLHGRAAAELLRDVRRRLELRVVEALGVGDHRVVLVLPGHRDHRDVVGFAARAPLRFGHQARHELQDGLLSQHRSHDVGRDLRPEAVGREQDGVSHLECYVLSHVDDGGHHAAQATEDLVAVRVP